MVKPRRGSGARSIHLARDPAQARFFVDYVHEPTMVQRAMGGPSCRSTASATCEGRCLNAIPRTMLESRGGESIKGQVIHDEELIELGRSVMERLRVRGPATIQVFRDPDIGLAITDVNTRFGGAFPAPAYAALPGRSYPELIVRMAAGEEPEPHVGEFNAGHQLHPLLLAARAGRQTCARPAARSSPADRPGAALRASVPLSRRPPRVKSACDVHGRRRAADSARARPPARTAEPDDAGSAPSAPGRRGRDGDPSVPQLRRPAGARAGMVPAVRRRRPGSARARAAGARRADRRRCSPRWRSVQPRRRWRRSTRKRRRARRSRASSPRHPSPRRPAATTTPTPRRRPPTTKAPPLPTTAGETPEDPATATADDPGAHLHRHLHHGHEHRRERRIAGLGRIRHRRRAPPAGIGRNRRTVGAAARHRRRLHLQPLQPPRQLLRRPQPHDRRRQRAPSGPPRSTRPPPRAWPRGC